MAPIGGASRVSTMVLESGFCSIPVRYIKWTSFLTFICGPYPTLPSHNQGVVVILPFFISRFKILDLNNSIS